MRRIRRLVAAAALLGAVAALLVVPMGTAGGQSGDVGYTYAGRFLGGASLKCDFLAVDLATAEATVLNSGGSVSCNDGLAFAPDGTLYGFRLGLSTGTDVGSQLVTIDVTTGNSTVVGALPAIQTGGMTFDSAGRLWLSAYSPNDPECGPAGGVCLWEVDPATAATTFVGGEEARDVGLPTAAAATCTEVQVLTEIAQGVSGTQLDRAETATGALTTIVDTPDVFLPEGADYSADGRLFAVGGEFPQGLPFATLYEIDPGTGASTSAGITIGGQVQRMLVFGLAISPLSCEAPPPPPVVEPVVLAPTFTG